MLSYVPTIRYSFYALCTKLGRGKRVHVLVTKKNPLIAVLESRTGTIPCQLAVLPMTKTSQLSSFGLKFGETNLNS